MCIITLNGDLVHLFINRNIRMPVLKCTFVGFSTIFGECICVSSINEKYDNGFSFRSGKTCWLKMFSEIRWNIHGNAANRYDMFNDSWNAHTTSHTAHTEACTKIYTPNQRNESIIKIFGEFSIVFYKSTCIRILSVLRGIGLETTRPSNIV